MSKISIVIVNYKTLKLTCQCIHSIFEQVHSCEYEVIVVDNDSSDGSMEGLKQEFGDKILLVASKENLGFGRANNLGVKYATGDYVFLLNSDTILKNDPFTFFLDFYAAHPDTGALGGYLHNGDSEFVLSGGDTYSANKYIKNAFEGLFRIKHKYELQFSDKVSEVDYVIGADLFMSMSDFKKVGGFNPHIFMYFEDVELCEKIRGLGKRNYVIPGPDIIHFVKSSSTSQFSRVYNTASMMFCMRNKLGAFRFRLFQFVYFLLKLPILARISNFKNEWEYLSTIYNYKKYLINNVSEGVR